VAKSYGSVYATFWTGKTGRRIRALGPEASLIALYLMTCPNRVMTGLYYLPLVVLSHETGVPLEGASKVLRSLEELDFCTYEEGDEVVFVHALARWQVGKSLKPTDNQVKGIEAALEPYLDCELFKKFWELYATKYHLNALLAPPSEGAPKGLASETETETRTKTGTERERPRADDIVRGLANRLWEAQEELRQELKAEGIGVNARGPGTGVGNPGKLELAHRISEALASGKSIADAEADCRHVLAVLGDEARAKRSVRWLDGQHWNSARFAKSLSLEPGELVREPAKRSGSRPGGGASLKQILGGA